MTQQPKTILDIMVADIFLNKEDNSLTILHDTAFDDNLLLFEYDLTSGELLFKFETKQMAFGIELRGEFYEGLKNAQTITVLQIDMDTNEPVLGLEVPLVIK
ncbi:MAG: hypothetical protein OEY94_01835 [Alphaproteobacteria bacterium]|nr:hypothetical protein [Alphaproteobacteria bacterium]